MIELIVILIGYIIAFELESSHDKILSNMGQTKEQSDKWHQLDSIFIIVLSLVIAYSYNGISLESGLVLVYAFAMRITYFPIRLNKKRDQKTFYLGSGWWDGKFKSHKLPYFITAFALLFGSIYLLILDKI